MRTVHMVDFIHPTQVQGGTVVGACIVAPLTINACNALVGWMSAALSTNCGANMNADGAHGGFHPPYASARRHRRRRLHRCAAYHQRMQCFGRVDERSPIYQLRRQHECGRCTWWISSTLRKCKEAPSSALASLRRLPSTHAMLW